MINEHVLQQFCEQEKGYCRPYDLTKPFSWEGFTFATNGHIAVRVPRLAEVTNDLNVCRMLPWDHAELTAWYPMPEYTLPEKAMCPQCAGEQYVKYCQRVDDYIRFSIVEKCRHRCNCPECNERRVCDRCDWHGRAYPELLQEVTLNPTTVNATCVNGHYLELIKALPGPWAFALDPKDPQLGTIRFKFEGGVGLLMPMRPKEGRIS